ncbi:methyltransferase [Microcoleus sp. FACHB-672]|uniref:methyltransferase n=1 Tax=Microcoleus sp. FACHB-672 TaxID=2692825 RepID=UPI0016886C27|nr:methyltransferase [Microcoleus sp. FACHB-672]MBD2043107.1 methyltransferase [Microcoleus sp. FACHB-672]
MSQSNPIPNSNETPAPMAMMQMISSRWVSQPLYVAAQLGIADLLKDGPKTIDELANATGTHAPSLYRLLRALASVSIFAEGEDGRFELTPLASCLQTGVEGSVGAMAIMFAQEWHSRPWEHLLESVKTGKTAFELVYGKKAFEYLAQNPEAGKIFDNAMTGITVTHNTAIAAAYDFSSISKLADIAGGHGGLIAAILNANPKMEGILFDQPHVIAGALPLLESQGVASRCKLIAGNFFESVPAGCDGYILKSIIHDWDDEEALAILKNCRKAMIGKNSKLLLVENVIPAGNEASMSKLVDLEMLVMAGGRERTEAEYRTLLGAAGFELTNIVPTQMPVSVIESVSS